MIRSHDKLQEPSPTVSSFSESTASVDTVSETTNQHESLQESLRVVEAPERNGHDYLQTLSDRKSFQNFEDLSSSDPDFTKFFNSVQKDSKIYQEMCSKNQIFKMEVIQQNKQLFNFYTGLDLDVFNSLFTYLQRKASSMQYFHGERTTYVQSFNLDGYGVKRKPGVTRQLSLQEEFFSVLYRLQTGHLLEECSLRFGVSSSQFSRNFTTWINLLSMELELLCKNAEPDEDVGLASCFKPFPNLRVILDCTELFSETPSSVEYHKQTHSNYKHHSTIKFLVGIHPSGAVTYISKAYPGKSSDKQITQESLDLIDSLIPGQKVMVDRGFTIEEDLPCGVKLVIPSFKGASRQQLTANELSKSKVISRARVHVERCMRRIKSFNILRQELKLSQVDVYEQIFKTCAYLVNFQNPYLKSDDYGVSELKHNADT